MNEFTTLYQVTGAGVALTIVSFTYSLGGRAGGPGKWVRRFLGSFILAATVGVLCLLRGNFHWGLLGVWPLLVAGTSLGYGGWATTTWTKILRRIIYALACLTSGVLCAYLLGAWAVLVPHVIVAAVSIYLGVKNPIDSVAEEFMVSMCLNLFLIAYPFFA